jgi:two-component system, chemotaxis family, response regulator Rcp1
MCPVARNGFHFLLVEDSRAHALVALDTLTEANSSLTVDHVSDGAMALAYLRHEPPFEQRPRPDAIILDLNIPKIDGLEVLRQVKSDPELQSIPVVVLTSSEDAADRQTAYRNYANSFLAKPVGGEAYSDMLVAIREYWANRNEPLKPDADAARHGSVRTKNWPC